MSNTEQIVAAYMDAWNEKDESKRKALIDKAWADDGHYVDPQADVKGRDGLFGLIAGFQAQMPGTRIDTISGVQNHHDRIRFNWRLVGAEGNTMVEGVDYGQLAEDGRIKQIVGFWGDPPAL